VKINNALSALLASLAIGASIASAPVSAQNFGQGFIKNVSYNKCLDFSAGNLSNAVTLQLWTCAGNAAINQQWNFIPAGSYPNGAPSYLFQNAMNYTCAAVENDSLSNAARVVQRTCDANNPSQHWIQTASGVLNTKTRWMNGRSGKCLDAWSSANGTVLQQYTCASSSNWPQQGFQNELFPVGGP
jgi:Ricin-type beta-trefoil lectin domain-like